MTKINDCYIAKTLIGETWLIEVKKFRYNIQTQHSIILQYSNQMHIFIFSTYSVTAFLHVSMWYIHHPQGETP
jgi:hypothetical protein